MFSGSKDLIIYGILNNFIGKLDFNNYLVILIAFIYTAYNYINSDFKNLVSKRIKNYFFKVPSEIILTYDNDKENISQNIEALILYFNKYCNVNKTKEIRVWKPWARFISNDEYKSFYRPADGEEFLVDKRLEIFATIETINHEIYREHRQANIQKRVVNICIKSFKLSNKELTKWLEDITEKHQNKTTIDLCNIPLMLDIFWDKGDADFKIENYTFDSNVTFENSYFPGQEEFLEELDFFETNHNFYKRHGIKRTKTILCSGNPGTGKTSLIKATINKTKRHAINIRITDTFPLKEVAKILKGNFGKDKSIDVNKVIFIFEEIDSIHDIIKDRNKVEKELKKEDESKKDELKILPPKAENTLATLLTELDGINESDGRIIFMTTNRLGDLDPALYRPGRVDYHYQADKYSKEDFWKFCKAYWGEDFKYSLNNIDDSFDNKYNSSELYQLFNRARDNFENIKETIIKTKKKRVSFHDDIKKD